MSGDEREKKDCQVNLICMQESRSEQTCRKEKFYGFSTVEAADGRNRYVCLTASKRIPGKTDARKQTNRKTP